MLTAESEDLADLIDRPGAGTPPPERRSLSGWGGSPRSVATVHRPRSLDDLRSAVPSPRGMVARGLGRSYGDAAQLSGGSVVDMTAMRGITGWDDGAVTSWAGTSLADITTASLARGWFLPVTPGTRHVTVGGAIAADIHGKNHHRDGSFGAYVTHLLLLTSDGRLLDLTPGDERFDATVGGMGLTGTIVSATIQLTAVESAWMLVRTSIEDDFDAVMAGLADEDERRRYTVAWVDLRHGSGGRGVVMAGDHAAADDLPRRRQSRPLAHRPGPTIQVPPMPMNIVTSTGVDLFNRVWFAKAPESATGVQSLDRFFYPLDALGGWNRLYGDRGFLQYQFVVPPEATDVLRTLAEAMATSRVPVSLAVLKRMGPDSAGMLSFPMEGWTLTVDMPLGDPDLGGFLDRCDRAVSAAGGRVYLAKDSRMRADAAHDMYDLEKWREVRAGLDPGGLIHSDLSERLALI